MSFINLKDKSLIICSIVRDSGKNLKKNISAIKKVCDFFGSYKIIVYENDSKDDTKLILNEWSKKEPHLIVSLNDIDKSATIPLASQVSVNPFFSRRRIEKMANLRNQYMKVIDNMKLISNYVIVVDLDVARLDANAILSSFRSDFEWDAVTAFGYSTSPRLSKRYHDTYALTEYGDENEPQTEKKIIELAYKYGNLSKSDKWVRVFSAFGGLAIYRYEAFKGLRYKTLLNNDENVEVKCEHYSIYQQMKEKGFDKVYINPSMVIKYQNLSFSIIWKSIKRNCFR